MKIISWNVNGLKSCCRKVFLHFGEDTKPDAMCYQEIKTQCYLNTPGYFQYWNPAKRPGYSNLLRTMGYSAIRIYLLRKCVTIPPLYGILADMGRVVCPLLQLIREGGRYYERIKNRAGLGRTDDL